MASWDCAVSGGALVGTLEGRLLSASQVCRQSGQHRSSVDCTVWLLTIASDSSCFSNTSELRKERDKSPLTVGHKSSCSIRLCLI